MAVIPARSTEMPSAASEPITAFNAADVGAAGARRPRCQVCAKTLLEPIVVAHRDQHDERCESRDYREYRGCNQPGARVAVPAHGENR